MTGLSRMIMPPSIVQELFSCGSVSMTVAKCNHNRTFCGSATHQMAQPIYYWSTDALNGACTKSFSSTRNAKEEGSSSYGDLGH
ncbi:hypothetical protein AVEN_234338-1 [Araneus ventricosus]|uniref:Uncharacterized protein n=1 Tax=Araneus ventricosus TaxID=182803 RepID=A0A4Y2A9J3_ARAVE|nr:hypothetical protein AVEN_234338-1 [Araneus ventricosus]